MKQQPEYNLQVNCVKWLRLQYPDVFFMSDTIAQVKLTPQQAARNKAIQCPDFKCPDIIIFEPRGRYCGLFIELKAESPYKKTGGLKKDKHIEEQDETMGKLTIKGYDCFFCWEFDKFVEIVTAYMEL